MTSQLAGVFDVSFATAGGMENDELSNLLRIPILLKSSEAIVEALYWIDDIILKAENGENKSLLLSQAYEAKRLRLPPALEELPDEPNRNTDEIAYAYWLGYIYRCECLLHEESSFSFVGYRVVRREFISHRFDPAMICKCKPLQTAYLCDFWYKKIVG